MQWLRRFHNWTTTSPLKTYVVLVLLSVIPLVLFLYSADRFLRSTTERRLNQQSRQFADLVAGMCQQQFGDEKNVLLSLAGRPDLVSAVERSDKPSLMAIMKQAHELSPEFGFVSIYDPSGNLLAIDPADQIVGRNFAFRDWYKGVIRSWTPYVSELYQTAARSNEMVAAVAVPVKSSRGAPIAILMAPNSIDTMRHWNRFVSASSSRFVEIVDQHGRNAFGKTDEAADASLSFEPVRRALAHESGSGVFQRAGEPVQAAYQPIPSVGWGVVIAIPMRDVRSAVSQFERPLLFLGLIFVGIAMVLGSVSAGLSRQLHDREVQLEGKNYELDLRNREVERANQMKSRFLASMSHELRTPLNAILGFSQLLTDGGAGVLNAKQLKWAEHVHKAGKHLLSLINDILDLAKIEAGHVELSIESFAVSSALPEVLSNVRPLAMSKQLQVVLSCDPGLTIKADRLRFKQVFYNLLSNAIKFTSTGGVRIDATVEGQMAKFVVADSGVGIRAEDLGVIFEEFRQVGDDSNTAREGTGLGLAITKRLIEQQGGVIRAESQIGVGTRFTFVLPLGGPQAAEAALPAQDTDDGDSARPSVLVVDDDPAACELLSTYLKSEGYATVIAPGGKRALELARELRPAAITLDILMPGSSGWETLYMLRNNRDTAEIPVIVISVIDQKNLGMTLGAADYLVKPVDREALLKAIGRHISKQHGAGFRCVAADDDSQALRLIADVLASAGCTVELAANGREALTALRTGHTDLLLLDLMMPEMDGFEVVRQMEMDPDLSRIPVIVLTAKTLTAEETARLTRNTQGLLHKNENWRLRLHELLRQTQERKTNLGAAR